MKFQCIEGPDAMAAPNVPTQAGPRCLSLPRLCSAPAREHIWSIDTSSAPVLTDWRHGSVSAEGFAAARPPETEFQVHMLQELARLSQQVDSLLRGQITIERMSNLIGPLGGLPDEIARLRVDVADALQQKYQRQITPEVPVINHKFTNQQLDSAQEKLKEEPKLLEDSPEVFILQDNDAAHNVGRGSCAGKRTSALGKKIVKNHGNGMFGDNHVTVKDVVDLQQYDVRDLYCDSGHMQLIARSDRFSSFMLFIIVINALYIGIEVDHNGDDVSDSVRVMFFGLDSAFCVVFVIEWIIRFLAFRTKCDCLRDLWFKFDSVLVLLMATETWLIPIILGSGYGNRSSDTKATGLVKLLRLLRLARIGRVLRFLPELVAMIKGLKVASRAVGAAFLMLAMIIYVFSIALFILLKDIKDSLIKQRFDRLSSVMWTILLDGTFLDSPGMVIRRLQSLGETIAIMVFMIFVLISALTVMNMLIGVLCAVVASVAESEKDGAAFRLIKAQILVLLQELDKDNSGLISRDEMVQVLDNECALETLHSLKVEESVLLAHLDMFFDKSEDLPFWQIMELILMLRGDTQPSMMHLTLSSEFLLWRVGTLIGKSLNVDVRGVEPVQMQQVTKFMSLK